MEPFQGVVLALLALLVMAWFILLERLAEVLARRHPRRYAALGLAAVRFRSPVDASESNNFGAVVALFRFLLGGESLQLADRPIRRLVLGMRGVLLASLVLALVFGATLVTGRLPKMPAGFSALVSSVDPQDREQALRLERAGQLAEAVAQLDRLLQPPVRDPELMYRRALVHVRLGHEDKALRDLAQVQEWEPGHFEAHLRADRILADQQRWGDILALWSRFLRNDPDHAQARLERARVHLHEGDKLAALADTRRACDLGRRDACRFLRRLQEGP